MSNDLLPANYELINEYDVLLRAITRVKNELEALTQRADLVRASLDEEDRARTEVLHGISWHNGVPHDIHRKR